MRHVDEGRLEAWLDRERSGMAADEVAEIDRHLESCAVCAARVADATLTKQRAAAVLGELRLHDRPIPAFEDVRARALGLATGGKDGKRSPVVPWLWAASVVVAVGVGYVARDWLAPRQLALDEFSPRTAVEHSRPAQVSESGTASPEPADAPGAADGLASVTTNTDTGEAVAADPRSAASVTGGAVGEVDDTDAPVPPVVAASPAAAPAAVGGESGQAPVAATGGALAADRPTLVAGRVVGPDGDPLPGAVVSDASGSASVTDHEGAFSLQVPRDTIEATDGIEVTTQAVGYEPSIAVVAGADGDSLSAVITMQPDPGGLDSIVVVGYGAVRRSEVLPPEIEARSVAPAARADGAPAAVGYRSAAAEPGAREPIRGVPNAFQAEPVSIDEASLTLGVPVIAVPELEILSVQLLDSSDGFTVIVSQRLPEGGTLVLMQSLDGPPLDPTRWPEGDGIATTQRGPLHVAALAPLSEERLAALLESAR